MLIIRNLQKYFDVVCSDGQHCAQLKDLELYPNNGRLGLTDVAVMLLSFITLYLRDVLLAGTGLPASALATYIAMLFLVFDYFTTGSLAALCQKFSQSAKAFLPLKECADAMPCLAVEETVFLDDVRKHQSFLPPSLTVSSSCPRQ